MRTARYTMTFRDREYVIPKQLFWWLAGPLIAFTLLIIAWACWMLALSAGMLADYTGIPGFLCGLAIVVGLGSVSINDRPYAFLPQPVREALLVLLMVGTVVYQYAVQHWSTLQMILLTAPFLVLGLLRLLKRR